ncbi:MAG TPA: right-handed parallel beta-helix repeat-containing protein [Sphingobium sp.]|nr:right-handed parallel beta-helix repeat-containing protein [Sphingobium sp.]
MHRLLRRLTLGLGGLLCAILSAPATAASYHVDATRGDDGNDGLSGETAWKSLARLRDQALMPGDRVLLATGSVWREPLVIRRSGVEGAPISFSPMGDGPRPRIDAGGVAENAIEIVNAEYVSVSGLEITNSASEPAIRRGVLIAADDVGVVRGITVSDLYIHDVSGTNARKDNGGILFRATSTRVPSRFEGLTIERNIIWRVDRTGISGTSDQVSRARWFPSRFVVIRDNHVEDVGGDGIVVRGTDGALIEHNIVRHAAARAPGYNAAIWPWSTDNTLIQLNEAGFTRSLLDGQGFDSDFNSRDTVLMYNYSHDNAGGFLLLCTPVARNDAENLGNTGTVARFNVSRHDKTRIFQLAGATNALIEGNVVHVAAGDDVQMAVATQWSGWSSDIMFRDNVFAVAGTARYGYEVGRNGGHYLMDGGFGPARNISFAGNAFLGRHVDSPEDAEGKWQADYEPPQADWDVPSFDPARPEGFDAYLQRHRQWMIAMLTRELGRRPRLQEPKLMTPDQARRP